MSKPDLEGIIRSPSAETFLRMVTKGFYDNSYIGLWMYEVIGREWDEMRKWSEGLKDEINPQTCTWSIGIWEWVYGIETDESLPIEYRRQRILAKIIGVRPINPEIIRRGVAALMGGEPDEVEVNDFVGPYRFEVILHPSGKSPFNYARIFEYVQEIKPSHLAFEAAVETKVDITIEIGTSWNLVGFGLTGQYNCGTRPNINTKGRLHDLFIMVDAEGLAAAIQSEVAGTKPQESVRVAHREVIVAEDVEAVAYHALYSPTKSADSETGRYPETQMLAGTTQMEIEPYITAKGFCVSDSVKAGTKPQTEETLNESGAIMPTIETDSYVVSFRMCGTDVTRES